VNQELLEYYVKEFEYLRQTMAEYRRNHPEVAASLNLDERGDSTAPHVKLLLHGVAALTARVHLKLDDQFARFPEELLGVLYPWLLRPVPSMTIAQFDLNPAHSGLHSIEKNTILYSNYQMGEDLLPCKFRTCYKTSLWPIQINEARWLPGHRIQPKPPTGRPLAGISIQLESARHVKLGVLKPDPLRFYLYGDKSWLLGLYEVLCNHVERILVREILDDEPKSTEPWIETHCRLKPVGFEYDEALMGDAPRSLNEYRLLQEYFLFPEKFLFVDLFGLRKLPDRVGKKLEVLLVISPFEPQERQQTFELAVSKSTLRLGCTPCVNLFSKSIGVRCDHSRHEYLISPSADEPCEVFSIDRVRIQNPRTKILEDVPPIVGRRRFVDKNSHGLFWKASRQPPPNGTFSDVYLTLIHDREAVPLETFTVLVDCTCTNGGIDSRIFSGKSKTEQPEMAGESGGDLELDGATSIAKITALKNPPTSRAEPLANRESLWHLVSQLSLNYLSIVEEGKEALQALLLLNAFNPSAEVRKQIAGIRTVRSRPDFAAIPTENGIACARGTFVHIDFDESQYSGSSPFLIASIIERFLGSYVATNSFSQLLATTERGERRLKQWAPRAGQTQIL
jgi:type VI secretion system protein ImpG